MKDYFDLLYVSVSDHSIAVFNTVNIFLRVSMGLTDRRKTAKNLVDSRKNGKILTVSRKWGKMN